LLSRPGRGAKIRQLGHYSVDPFFAGVVRWRVALAIGLGVVYRLAMYLPSHKYWMDEERLVENIQKLSPAGFFGPMLESQLAPPGFLLAAWSAMRLFGHSFQAMRLVPFLGGIGGLFLFRAVARRVLPDRAVFPAVLMLATAYDPVYYSGEVKQYSTDLASGLACLLIGLTIGSRPLKPVGAAGLAAFGALIVWFSHPSIFVLASVGLVGLAREIPRRDGRGLSLWVLVGLAWVVSFAGVHAVSTRQLGGTDHMWRFWNFAFPPIPPRSVWDATWFLRRLAYYFVNPLNFTAPIGERLSMLPALCLAFLGADRLWKLDRARCALVILPVILTLVAASLRLYPFHGRLVLFLVPIPLLAIAAGLEAVREARGRGVLYYALATMVLAVPAVVTAQDEFSGRPAHNGYGDMHPYDINPAQFPL